MASHSPLQCPNCLTPYARHARFCAACGRGRDDAASAASPSETTDQNRSVMLVTKTQRTAPISPPRRSRQVPASPVPPMPAQRTVLALPTLKPGVIVCIAILFFGLVWTGRLLNAPQKATRPVVAPISVIDPNDAESRRIQRRLEANEQRDLREAEEFAEGLRAQAASEQLQAHLRNSQAPPPSAEPKPFDVIQVHPVNGK